MKKVSRKALRRWRKDAHREETVRRRRNQKSQSGGEFEEHVMLWKIPGRAG